MFGLSIFNKTDKKNNTAKGGYNLKLSAGEAISLACADSLHAQMNVIGRLGNHDSVFLGYDAGLNSFFVAPIKSAGGTPHITPNKSVIRFHFQLHGVRRMFRSIFSGSIKWNGATAWRFEIPELIEVIQRRQFYRVKPNPAHPVHVLLRKGGLVKSKAFDISAGGVSFDFTIKLATGQRFPVSIQLPTIDPSFSTDIRTKGIEVVKTQDYKKKLALLTNKLALYTTYKVRAEFLKLNLSKSQLIERYIADRQRDILKSIV